MTMSEVFRARFDGREWWATLSDGGGAVGEVADMLLGDCERPGFGAVQAFSNLTVPAHMVERVEETPPEPKTPGTVIYDADDVAWQRDHTTALPWRSFSRSGRDDRDWRDLKRPTHPYPRAAREEIERLTVHLKAKDAHNVEMATQIKRLRAERDAAQSAHGQACAAADELQRRIDRALDELASLRHRTVDIAVSFLRGEVDQ
jgi:hypothetical protein